MKDPGPSYGARQRARTAFGSWCWCSVAQVTSHHMPSPRRRGSRARWARLAAPLVLALAAAGCGGGGKATTSPSQSVQPAPIQPSINHLNQSALASSLAGPLTRDWVQALSKFVANYPKKANAAQRTSLDTALSANGPAAPTCDPDNTWHCWYGSDTPARTWMVMGDSTQQWWPALLANTRRHPDLRVEMFSVPNCVNSLNPQGLLRVGEFGTTPDVVTACTAMHDAAVEFLRTNRPSRLILMGGGLRVGTSREAQYTDGLKQLVRSAPQRTTVVIIGRVPTWNVTPSGCLNEELTNLQTCFGRATTNQNVAVFFSRVAREMDVAFVDPKTLLCSSNICPLFIGNDVVTADGSRLATGMSEVLAPVLYENVMAAGE